MTELEKAIESLYATFARYPRPSKIEACPCGCTKPGATDCLVEVPLRDLRFADLEDYSSSAMTTQGTVDDFRYLLPRLFQGIVEEEYGYNPESLFGKLVYAKWFSWPQDEVAAVCTYFRAFWQTALSSFPIQERLPAFFEIETVLASIAHSGEGIEPYLNIWTETRTKHADQHLIQFVTIVRTRCRETDPSMGLTLRADVPSARHFGRMQNPKPWHCEIGCSVAIHSNGSRVQLTCWREMGTSIFSNQLSKP